MQETDVSVVQEIERHIFSTPWPRNAYHRELNSRNSAYYVVLRRYFADDRGEIVGYAGVWRRYDEAHVTTVGARHDTQRSGYARTPVAGVGPGRHAPRRPVPSPVPRHAAYGGGVPGRAGREHLGQVAGLVGAGLGGAGARRAYVGLGAATRGPGLVGCLLVGHGLGQG